MRARRRRHRRCPAVSWIVRVGSGRTRNRWSGEPESDGDLDNELVAALGAARGGLLLIAGEAGIGKTALVMDGAREAAARGALVLIGACDDLAQTSPYGPWFAIIQACHDQCPELPPLSGRVAAGAAGFAAFDGQDALVDGIHQLLRDVAARSPVLVVLEDIHWADAASLAALHRLARGLDGAGLLLIATYRPEELGHRHPLAALLLRLVREGRVERIDLRELDDGATRELVRHRYLLTNGDATRLAAYLPGQERRQSLLHRRGAAHPRGRATPRGDGRRVASRRP